MKKLFSLFVAAFVAMSMMAVDWSGINFLGDGAQGGALNNKYKLTGDGNPVNVQQPGTPKPGIYVTFADAAFGEVRIAGALADYNPMGAAICIYLDNFVQQETEVQVMNSSNTAVRWTFYVYYADGTTGGGEEGGETPEPEEPNTEVPEDAVTLTSGDKTIHYTAYIVADNEYELTIYAEENLAGLGGSFWNLNTGGSDLRTNISGAGTQVLKITATSTVEPQLYTPLFVLMPGEVNFGQPTFTWIDKREITRYYMKHPWNGGSWEWKELTQEGSVYTITDFYGNNGCNYNTTASDTDAAWVAEPTLVDAPESGDKCLFTLNPADGTITIAKVIVPSSPYCQTEVGHLADANAAPASFVLLSIGNTDEGKTIVHIDQDAAKNDLTFDYLQVTGYASTGKNDGFGAASLGVEFATPAAGEDGMITLEILWSTNTFEGNWMVQNVKVPATATCESATVALMPSHIYFVNKPGWESVYCYTRGDEDNPSAVGTEATKLSKTIEGYDVYAYAPGEGDHTCRFTDGTIANKSFDLYIKDGYYYTLSTYWPADSVNMVLANVYLLGLSDDAWKASEDRDFSDDITLRLDGGATLQYKVLYHGDWLGNNGTMTADNNQNWTFEIGKNNCQLTTVGTNPAYYTFVWNEEAKQVSVTYPDVYLIKHGWGDGADTSWSWKEMLMNEDGTYTLEDQYGATGCNWKLLGQDEAAAAWVSVDELIKLNDPQLGDDCIFTFNPETGEISVNTLNEHGQATGCDEAEAQKAQKIVRDGKIVILKNGAEYSVLGQKL